MKNSNHCLTVPSFGNQSPIEGFRYTNEAKQKCVYLHIEQNDVGTVTFWKMGKRILNFVHVKLEFATLRSPDVSTFTPFLVWLETPWSWCGDPLISVMTLSNLLESDSRERGYHVAISERAIFSLFRNSNNDAGWPRKDYRWNWFKNEWSQSGILRQGLLDPRMWVEKCCQNSCVGWW